MHQRHKPKSLQGMVMTTRSNTHTRFPDTDVDVEELDILNDKSDKHPGNKPLFTDTDSDEEDSDSDSDSNSNSYSYSDDEDLEYVKDCIVMNMVRHELGRLRRKSNLADGSGNALLLKLNRVVQRIQQKFGVSNRRMKLLMWDMGVCLSNAKVYGSAGALKRFLKTHPAQRVSTHRAKQTGVKCFLLSVW